MTAMTDRDTAVSSCRAVVAGYHREIDSGRATAGIGAFDEHAEFEAHGRTYRGRAEILEFLTAREANTGRQTVHVLANETVSAPASDEQRIELRAFVLLHVRQPDGAYRLERVLDTVHHLRRADQQWRITRRTSTLLHPAT